MIPPARRGSSSKRKVTRGGAKAAGRGPDKLGLGARVRALREERGLSLRELAARAGMAVSFVSKIESGKASPTLMSLVKLLEALDLDLAAFFSSGAAAPAEVVCPRALMRPLNESDRTWWLAFPGRRDLRMSLTYEEYSPRSRLRELERHPTDLCGYVLEGTLTLELPGRGLLTASAGDAFYLKAGQEHVAQNAGDQPLRLIAVQLR